MIKVLTILLLSISMNGISQTALDIAISNFKKVYKENVKPPYSSKIYFNKVEKLIDVGFGEFQIPLSADIIFKLDTSFIPPQNALVFSWKVKKEGNVPSNFPDQKPTEKSITIVFKSKDACYTIIDAIAEIKQLMNEN